ncbi:hypothetical protein RHOSPDRAFT_30922 [Rhodotorula sp. JG-1b]|nr:hypothetical protein RHOSPDRAFT_30922 [Rhodotorula sp. JG-1b]
MSVLALATVALASRQPDLAPRSDLLSHGGAQSRMRLRHKRQLDVGGIVNGLTGAGGVAPGSGSAASASVAVQQSAATSAAEATTSTPAVAASTQPAATSAQATSSAPATPSSSSQASASSASEQTSSSASDPADETSSSTQRAVQTSAQTGSSVSTESSTSEVASRVTSTVISSAEASSSTAATSTSQSSASSASASSTASSSAASASGSNSALNSDGKSSSSSSGGLPKPALIAIIVVGSVLVGALAIWYIIRKTALSPSKRFEKRLRSELDFSPNPTDPDLNDHNSYEPDDAHLVPGTLAHARNISGMSDDRPYGMAGQGVAPGYASSLARSDSGGKSLPGTPPQMSEGLGAMPTMPYSGQQYMQQPYYGAPASPPAAGPGYSQEPAYSFGELHRAGSTGSQRPLSPMMQIPYQSPTAAQMPYDHAGNGLDHMPTIAINQADAYGVPYRPDSRAQHQHHY